jgi:glycosyltransferase involved in cell wall biosynthesis
MASYIGALLPIPYLRGPGGGAHRTPKAFLSEYSFSARFWEAFRSFGQWVLRRDPVYVRGQRRARAILLCNREAADAVPRNLRPKVQLFPVNGVSAEDLKIFAVANGQGSPAGSVGQDEQGVQEKAFHVFSAGKLLALKGYPLAIRAFGLFAKGHPDVKFTIVGDGPERGRLEKEVQNLGLGERVSLGRWTPRQELLAAMRRCDIFLFPSLRDGGGAVVVEAMAAGKPVVCLDLAGPGLHVTEECGIKIPARTPDETIGLMAQALERLYEDRELRMKMGQAAGRRVQQHYYWDRLGERLLRIYNEVLTVPSQEA